MAYKMKNSLGNLLNKTDMSKLRSKQSRASKGVSEHQHFSKQGTQGDEPRVEYSSSPMKNDKSKKKKETSLEKAKRGLGLTKEQIEEEKRKQKEALKKYEEKYG